MSLSSWIFIPAVFKQYEMRVNPRNPFIQPPTAIILHKTYRGGLIRERSSIDYVAEEGMLWVAGKVCGLYLIKVGLPSSIHRTTIYCRFCISPLIIITSSVTSSEWDGIRINHSLNHSFLHRRTKMQIHVPFCTSWQTEAATKWYWLELLSSHTINEQFVNKGGCTFQFRLKSNPSKATDICNKKLCSSSTFQFELKGYFRSTCLGNVLPCRSISMICTTI